jgi:hypothetical protein
LYSTASAKKCYDSDDAWDEKEKCVISESPVRTGEPGVTSLNKEFFAEL